MYALAYQTYKGASGTTKAAGLPAAFCLVLYPELYQYISLPSQS